jgi:hypothetical protein
MTNWNDRESIRNHVRHENKIRFKKWEMEKPMPIKNRKYPKKIDDNTNT